MLELLQCQQGREHGLKARCKAKFLFWELARVPEDQVSKSGEQQTPTVRVGGDRAGASTQGPDGMAESEVFTNLCVGDSVAPPTPGHSFQYSNSKEISEPRGSLNISCLGNQPRGDKEEGNGHSLPLGASCPCAFESSQHSYEN